MDYKITRTEAQAIIKATEPRRHLLLDQELGSGLSDHEREELLVLQSTYDRMLVLADPEAAIALTALQKEIRVPTTSQYKRINGK